MLSELGEMAAGVERTQDNIHDYGCARWHTARKFGGRSGSRAADTTQRAGSVEYNNSSGMDGICATKGVEREIGLGSCVASGE